LSAQLSLPVCRIPWPVKLAFTVFTAVLVPVFCHLYGTAVMCYFCDVALLLTLLAVWTESPLVASMAAVGILIPQFLWLADFLTGARLVGMTAYMYDSDYPLYARGLTLFHGWLPLVLIWLVYRLGYDRRALPAYMLLAWGLILVSYLWLPAPPVDPDCPLRSVNINYVYGISNDPQTWMHPHLWVLFLMVAFPICFYLPTHLVLARWCGGLDVRDERNAMNLRENAGTDQGNAKKQSAQGEP
jgi:hypothetical protein